MVHTIDVKSTARNEMIDITDRVTDMVTDVDEGVVVVFTPHTTGAVTINENADPDVPRDVLGHLSEMVPNKGFRHAEGNSDAHIKSSLVGASETIIVKDGRLVLGTWQSVFFCEFDGPRRRKVHVLIR